MNDGQYKLYRKLKLTELETSKQYKFYDKNNNITFDAIFDSIIGDVLIVRNYKCENMTDEVYSIRTIPKSWIEYAESENFIIKINNYIG